ncbi:MAG: hypothetical protein U0638_05065 [Phycisphaerales bacterium]
MKLTRAHKLVLVASGALMLAFGAVQRGEPRAPTKPVDVLTEIGSVATDDDKAVISVGARISGTDVRLFFLIKDNSFMGSSLGSPLEEASDLRDALKAICAEVQAGRTSERNARSYTVSGVSVNGQSSIKVAEKRKAGEIRFERGEIKLDVENAETMADRLQKAIDVGQWLLPRLDGLKSNSPQPGGK